MCIRDSYRSGHDFSLKRALRSERWTLAGIFSLSILIPLAARYFSI